jgi:hypothetical protein
MLTYYYILILIDFKNQSYKCFNCEKIIIYSMQVLILSDGMRKRLKPMTEHVPKPLVPLNNIPITECAKK